MTKNFSSSIIDWVENAGPHKNEYSFAKNKSINRIITEYVAITKLWINKIPNSEEAEILQNGLLLAKALPRNILNDILLSPLASYWVTIVGDILQRRINGDNSIKEFDTENIYSINRVLLAGAIKAKIPTKLSCIPNNKKIHIQPLGIFLSTENNEMIEVQVKEEGEILLNKKNNSERLTTQIGKIDKIPYISTENEKKIYIDNVEPTMNRIWIQMQKFPNNVNARTLSDGNEVIEWTQAADSSMNLIKDVWYDMYREIFEWNNTLVPVYSSDQTVNISCTSDIFRQAMLISLSESWLVGEALVHEHSHNILYELMSIYDILIKIDKSDENYYSPWRPDKRHLFGIIHAVYVFERVSQYYERLVQIENYKGFTRRIALIQHRLLRGILMIEAFAKLGDYGKEFLNFIKQRVKLRFNKYTDCFSKSVLDEIESHSTKWKSLNPKSIILDFDSLYRKEFS